MADGPQASVEVPVESMFPNVTGGTEVDEESPAKGGGDDENSEEVIYGKDSKPKSGPRDPSEED